MQTHVEIARDVRDDLLQDGKVTIDGRAYDVHPKILEAIRNYPAFYYGGTVGPDGFPDITYGQGTMHPVDAGIWMQRVLDMAWAAQSSSTYSAAEKQQILAWSYGFLTHGAGDVWAHTLMNDFAEGVFPPFATLPTNARNFANAARHFLVESYIGDATPGIDDNSDRSLLPDGDISSTSSVGERIAAPAQFLYEAFIKHFAGEPTVPKSSIVANINMDMFLPLYPMKSVMVLGLDESDLGDRVRDAAKRSGLGVNADSQPERNRFTRSDQYSFIRQGVPALALKVGFAPGSPEAEIDATWTKERYHAPSDDLQQPIDLGAAVTFTRLVSAVSAEVATHPARPRWKPTSFFRRFAADE